MAYVVMAYVIMAYVVVACMWPLAVELCRKTCRVCVVKSDFMTRYGCYEGHY